MIVSAHGGSQAKMTEVSSNTCLLDLLEQGVHLLEAEAAPQRYSVSNLHRSKLSARSKK